MKKFYPIPFLFLLVACLNESVAPNNDTKLSQAKEQIQSSVNDFGFDLFKHVHEDKNTFISPYSVSIALGMALNGASEEVRESIINTIDFDGLTAADVNQTFKDLTAQLLSSDSAVDMNIANSVWYPQMYNVKTDFSKNMGTYYDAAVRGLDFGSRSAIDSINNWVADKTNNRIKDLINQIDPNEIMFLINTIYFKAQWQYPFDVTGTHKADFTRGDGSIVTADMMHVEKAYVQYKKDDDVTLVQIPYGSERYVMTILVPTTGTLHNLADSLSSKKLKSWLEMATNEAVSLEMPKFKITYKKDLKETLKNMGMKMDDFPNIFDNSIVGSPLDPIVINRVLHQSFVNVDENGTEAAVATGIGLTNKSLGATVKIDRPFLFLIRELNSGIKLFSGQVVDPTAP